MAALIVTPLATFAQSDRSAQAVTHHQQLAQLAQPSSADAHHDSAAVQVAEPRANAGNDAAQTSGYGAPAGLSSQAGSRQESSASSYSPPVAKYTR
jgi:hypothetical protein